jgi:hypothetical protein
MFREKYNRSYDEQAAIEKTSLEDGWHLRPGFEGTGLRPFNPDHQFHLAE